MVRQKLLSDLKEVVADLGYQSTDTLLSISKNPEFGDYTTNIALQLANLEMENGKQNSLEIAKQIIKALGKKDYLEKIEVAGSGFINFYIKEPALIENLPLVCNYTAMVDPQIKIKTNKEGKKIMVEYTDPNPFKEFHIGHLYTNTIGESLSRILESTGAEVKRANYFGDVGLHVAKSVWGMKKALQDKKKKLGDIGKKSLAERIKFMAECYVLGSKSFEENEKVREEVKKINFLVYISAQNLQKSADLVPKIDFASYTKFEPSELNEVDELYLTGRQWSLEYFETIYKKLDTKFDFYYPESLIGEQGIELVSEHIKDGLFVEDQGAVIFKGEDYGLHTRVFINSLGLPTYEAKELGLAVRKYDDFKYDLSIVVTGNEIKEYYQVLLKVLGLIKPELAPKIYHIPHGMIRMVGGKVSSRKGNVLTFEWLFDQIQEKVRKVMEKTDLPKEEKDHVIEIVSIGAIRMALLKQNILKDSTFDLEKSVSLQGDSGPYVQYSYARAKSVLRAAQYDYQPVKDGKMALELEERMILRRIEQFPELVKEAADSFAPQAVANFLLDLSKEFNLFYQKHPIIKASENSAKFRLALTCAVAVSLKQGLYLLGIEAPERM